MQRGRVTARNQRRPSLRVGDRVVQAFRRMLHLQAQPANQAARMLPAAAAAVAVVVVVAAARRRLVLEFAVI